MATPRALETACRDVGFFYLVGHGVPSEDIRALHASAQGFFNMPLAHKEAIALSHSPASGRGYQRLGENVTRGRRDWHEAIDFWAEPAEEGVDMALVSSRLAKGAASSSGGSLQQAAKEAARMRPFVFGRNQWPTEPAGFRETLEPHMAKMAEVGGALMDAMALAFDLPEGHFRPLTDRSFWCCRVIGYHLFSRQRRRALWVTPLVSTQTMGVGRSWPKMTHLVPWK